MITVIILTYNEELHLERAIESVRSITKEIIIVDSFSTDRTKEIALNFGAHFYENPFVNQAQQFQWALDNLNITSEWILRLDADEFLTKELCEEINQKIQHLEKEITGIILKRQVHFMDKWIKHGGYYPTKLLRLFRYGKANIEQKWMDEHIKLKEGKSIEFVNDFIDANKNNLSWWISKHNNYSTRESIDILNKKYDFFDEDSLDKEGQQQDEIKRKRKEGIYLKLPMFLRAFLYFLYRYFLKLGFLDGKKGLMWHFLQGFWYRFLVDAKIYQIEYFSNKYKMSVKDVLKQFYNIKL